MHLKNMIMKIQINHCKKLINSKISFFYLYSPKKLQIIKIKCIYLYAKIRNTIKLMK